MNQIMISGPRRRSAFALDRLAMSEWLQRARQPALSSEFKRFIVVRNTDASEVFQNARNFTTGQGLAGSPELQVVPSLDEALRLFSVTDLLFEPVA